jgi:MYXO-CTERM domain-containing protein
MDPVYDPLWDPFEEDRSLAVALAQDRWNLRLGLLGGTDAHDTRPGATCGSTSAYTHMPYGGGLTVAVLPPEETWSREALYQAIVERRTYVTSGPKLPVLLDYFIAGEQVASMGEEITVADEQTLEVQLRVPEEHAEAVLSATLRTPTGELELSVVGDGQFELTIPPDQRPAWAYAVLTLDGERWYDHSSCDDGGSDAEERLWLSPTWFDTQGGVDSDGPPADDTGLDSKGCTGCRASNAAPKESAALTTLLSLVLLLRRRIRVVMSS